MTPAETATILRQFNEWRQSDEDIPQFDPCKIGEAIDAAVEMIDHHRRAEMNTPTPDNGEIHVATIQIAGQAPYHLVLLPYHPKDEMTHQAATEWAASLGGDLPTRPEQALLAAHQRDQFDRDSYWSNTLHESDPDCAWYQYFRYGGQGSSYRGSELRARAVRREYF